MSKPANRLILAGSNQEKCLVSGSAVIAIRHALFWMIIANGVGLWLAWLLLFPVSGEWLGEYTYGRWMPLHLNLHLYGWSSLPLVGWLLAVFEICGKNFDRAGRAAIWAWSMALGLSAVSWLGGQTSGKIFLDWMAHSRVLFLLVMIFLWGVLAMGWWRDRRGPRILVMAKAVVLVVLAAVPFALYWASGRGVYPAVNPDTGGPTGADLLGSTLGVVIILLLFPLVQNRQRNSGARLVSALCWGLLVAQIVLVASIGMRNASHQDWQQWVSLGSLTSWIVLLPLYYRGFVWPDSSRLWLRATLVWFGALTATGWLSFLPGILDHLKFTDGLVAHSHLAMAGFVTSFNVLLIGMIVEPGLSARLNQVPTFWIWNGATAVYVGLMWVAGVMEGKDPAFTIVPGIVRNLIYGGRLGVGILMLGVSIYWWRGFLELTKTYKQYS